MEALVPFRATTVASVGLAGASAPTRYVGGTTSGAPASGSYTAGDWVVAQDGKVWVCTSGGSPGTWTSASSGTGAPAVTSVDGRTGDVTLGDLYLSNVTGTTNRIAITGKSQVDIAASYLGQSSITTVGTITSGTWNAGAVTSSVAVQAALSTTAGGFRQGASGPSWLAGTGTPEGAVTAPVGSMFSRTDGAANTSLYRKETGAGNTGWTAVSTAAAPPVSSVDGRTGVVTLSDLYLDVAGDTMTGNLGLGQAGPTAKLQFAAATTTAGGILFGTDTTLYRSAADTLKTDDSFEALDIAVGVNPAQAGAIALANNASIAWRNAANTADITAIMVSSNNDTLIQAGTGRIIAIGTQGDSTSQMYLGLTTAQKVGFWGKAPIARPTGWAAATGTATRTTYATTTATLTQVAERLKALIDDLINMGLIGA